MKVAIMQPYFFPYIGYWQLINAVDKFIIYDDVNYIKSGWINRNQILVNNQNKFLNLKILKASSNKKINELNLLNDITYNTKILKTIKENYSRAPYFEPTFPLIKEIIYCREENLAQYLKYLIIKISSYLGIQTEIIVSSTIDKNNELKGAAKVVDICKLLSATQYINAIGGQELYSKEQFNENQIELNFLRTLPIKYQQFAEETFIPNLSIIDVMMFNSPEEIGEMLDNYELI